MVKESRYLHIGLGGRNCGCCFPTKGSKDRRKQYRIAKRKADREAMRNAEAELEDDRLMQEEAIAEEFRKAYGPDDWAMDDWSDYYDKQDLALQQEDEDDYYDDDYSYENDWTYDDMDYSIQSEQEKVARALAIALIGDDIEWRGQLTNARRFMEAMKRNEG